MKFKMFKPHASGSWYKFIIPRAIVDVKEFKLIRWLNFYFRKDK